MASYFDLLREDAVILGDEWVVTVEWDKRRQERREIYETLPRTQELWSLPDYAENEYYYLMVARDRDRWMGIPIESDEAIILREWELYPHPPMCRNSGWCRTFMNSARKGQTGPYCACDQSFQDEHCLSDASYEVDHRQVEIEAWKAANLAKGLGPCLPGPGRESSAKKSAGSFVHDVEILEQC